MFFCGVCVIVDVDKLKIQLEALRRNFIDQLPQRLAALEAGLAAWRLGWGETELAEFHRLAHSLTGAGATFGCEALSQVARMLEKQLVSAESAKDLAEVERLLNEIRLAIQVAGEDAYVEPELPVAHESQSQPKDMQAGKTVYILEDEAGCRIQLAAQLEYFGYRAEVFATPSELKVAVERQAPAIIIADIVMVEGALAGIDVIRSINGKRAEPIPVVFISTRDDFEARLEAVRVGGRAYFKKPFVFESLLDMVDQLAVVEAVRPYRVLVVDDSEPQALFYSSVLAQAGMEAEVVVEAGQVLAAIKEFSPELVLMDMYMPYCNGVELASVIRQQPDYLGLPIVFLSAETDRNIQLEALSMGGDDFLTKPIKSADLIASISIRAERYRNLRSRMSEDSLTGLLNHRRIMENLYNEVARAVRHGGQLAYAMLDIDHFKQVNDNYGHAVGDRVIKSLSRLLKQRLRGTDIIGRYGGEEFAVIMPETSLQAAVEVMEEVRQSFAALEHHAAGKIFKVCLSGGIAVAPPFEDAGELREAADQMLYKAKQDGRNQIVADSA